MGTNLKTKFQKFDDGKPQLSLVPHEALWKIAETMTYGATKYGVHNWRQATSWNRYYDAAMRHLIQWQSGEELDPESGLPHLAHAGANIMMLLALAENLQGLDDRWGQL